MEKLLTIIIPSYNMEKYLARGVESLIVDDKRLLEKLDIIIVNDGSKDNTSAIGHDLSEKYHGVVRIIDKPNGNYGSCINAALKIATGLYVRVLDADDTFNANAFKSSLEDLLKVVPSLPDVVLTDYCMVGFDGALKSANKLPLPAYELLDLKYIVDHNVYIAMMNTAIRTSLFKEINYHQSEGVSYTDTEWRFVPVAHAKSFYYTPHRLYEYFIGREGQTVSAAVASRSHQMYFTVLKNMTVAFEKERKTANADMLAYLNSCFIDYIRNMYVNCVSRMPYCDLKKNFCELDQFVKDQLSHLYPQLAELWLSSLFHFNYVTFMRNHPAFCVPYAFLVRTVIKLSSLRK